MFKNCNIIDGYIEDYLYPITTSSTNNNVEDWFSGNVSNISINKTTHIPSPIFSNPYWTPNFGYNHREIQKIKHRGISNKNFIGINEYISFAPQFKKYFGANNAQAVINWRLNSYDFPFFVTRGLFFWSRKVSEESISRNFVWDKLATYIPFYDNDSGPYIKLPEDRILISQNTSSAIENNNIKNVIDILGTNYKNKTYRIFSKSKENNSEIWIPDGDVFSYRDDINIDTVEKSFISATLYSAYNAIYHAITINRPKSIYRNTRESRRYKNLAKYLATSPYISDFDIDYMKRDKIQTIVDNHIKGKTDFQLSLTYISRELNSLNISTDFNLNDENNRKILRTPNQILQKLKNKYGVQLAISSGGSINLSKTELPHGDNLAINHAFDLVTNDSAQFAQNSSIIATQTINVGNYSLSSTKHQSSVYGDYQKISTFSKDNGGAYAKTNDIPVFDGILPQWNRRLNFNIVLKYDKTEAENANENNPDYWSPAYKVFTFIPPKIQNDDSISNGNSKISNEIPFPEALYSPTLPNPQSVPVITLSAFYPILAEELFNSSTVDLETYDTVTEAAKDFRCVWSQVSGPTARFTDRNKSGLEKRLYAESTDDIVDVVFSDYGEITIKCEIFSPQGTYVKYKTFFLITEDGFTVEKEFNTDMTTSRKIVQFGDPDYPSHSLGFLNQMNPIPLNPKNIKVLAPSFNKVAFNANGVIWPVSTDFKLITGGLDQDVMSLKGEKFIFHSEPLIKPNNNTNRGVSIKYDMPNNVKVYLQRIVVEKVRDGTSECSDCLSLFYSNLTGYTRRAAGEGVTGNTLGYTNFFQGFSLYDIVKKENIDFEFPKFSTDFGSPLKSYGAYKDINELQIDDTLMKLPQTDFGIYPEVSGFEFDYLADWRTARGESSSGGLDSNNIPRHKLCYMQAYDVIEGSYDDRDSYIEFEKGSFIPESGWVRDHTLNKSYVLKFNPGARDSFAFNGPRIDIQGNDVKLFGPTSLWGTQLVNSPSVFTSTVTLGIASGIQWDPLCECPPTDDREQAKEYARKMRFQNTQNQLHKEYSDSDQPMINIIGTGNLIPYKSMHGYRILAGGNSRPIQRTNNNNYISNDEFSVEMAEHSLKDYELKYNFAVTGPAKFPGEIDPNLKEYFDNPTNLTDEIVAADFELRDPKINTAQIKDLEVNLRFLNYVNTQDLVVWLEVEMCELEIKNRAPYRPKGKPPLHKRQINAPPQFIDQQFPSHMQYLMPLIDEEWDGSNIGVAEISKKISNEKLADYLKALTKQNSSAPQKNFRLFLLNQEYVKNNEFNMNLKFSDHAEKGINANSYKNSLNFAVENGGQLNASTAAMGYSEQDHAVYDKIIKENNLYITCNTFSKFFGTTLFMTPPPEFGPCKDQAPKQQGPGFDGKTKFMLKIATIDESDLMGPYDNLKNNVLAPNFVPDREKIQSDNPFNNLCSWEIIVHTDSEIKSIPKSKDFVNYGSDSDILGYIDYQTKSNRQGYPGYSFIADLTDFTALLPLANINSPFNYIYDTSTCISSSVDPLKRAERVIFPDLQWPDGAIANILSATASAAAFAAGGGMAGAGMASYLAAAVSTSPIINYLNETRKWRGLDRKLGEVYNMDHAGYELGSSDKILLNVSKDGAFWYTVEATIFRLANTPSIKTMTRKILPIANADTALNKLLSVFEYTIVNSYNDLFEDFENKIIDDFYMSTNNIFGGMDAFEKLNYEKDSNYTIIKIENPIVFDLYDLNDNMIFIDKENKANPEKSMPIIGKAKILINNKYCSIFIFNSGESTVDKKIVRTNSEIKLNKNIIAIIEPITSYSDTLEDPEENVGSSEPLSQWKFNGDIDEESYDEQWSSSMSPIIQKYNFNSRGSYGDISANLEKNYLHQLTKTNKIKKLYEIYNNRSNSKLKYNKILLYDKTLHEFSDAITSKTKAFGFSLDEFRGLEEIYDTRENEGEKFVIENNITKADFVKLQKEIDTKHRNKKYKNNKNEIIYIKNDDFIDFYINELWDQYDISVQGDMVVNNKVNFEGEIKDIEDRINILQGEVDLELLGKYDINSYVKFFESHPSIQSALEYYSNILNSIDNKDYDKLNLISDNIQKLCVEKNALQKLIKQIAGPNIKSHVTAELVAANNRVNVYQVNYYTNNNLYWINIDPKQSCGIAEELRPKVLVKTITRCSFLDPNLQGQENLIDNNICYQAAYGHVPEKGDIQNLSFDDSIPGLDFPQTLPIVYEIPEETINKNKENLMEKYPTIANWKEQIIFRSFYMPMTKQINEEYSQNYIIFVEEHYEVAVPEEHNLDMDDALQNFNNDYSADVNSVAGLSGGEPQCTLGSPGGLGLLTDTATRSGAPTRVYNIFNLDNTTNLRVKLRKIPKMLRGIDFLGTIYRYGVTSQYRQEQLAQPLQPLQTTIGQGYLYNFPYFWQCYEYDAKNVIQRSSIPTILMMMNEITFRAYMGSADNVEHKDPYAMRTEFAHDILPFEYYRKIDIPK